LLTRQGKAFVDTVSRLPVDYAKPFVGFFRQPDPIEDFADFCFDWMVNREFANSWPAALREFFRDWLPY